MSSRNICCWKWTNVISFAARRFSFVTSRLTSNVKQELFCHCWSSEKYYCDQNSMLNRIIQQNRDFFSIWNPIECKNLPTYGNDRLSSQLSCYKLGNLLLSPVMMFRCSSICFWPKPGTQHKLRYVEFTKSRNRCSWLYVQQP